MLSIDFYVLFKKKYKSFDRHFFNPPQQLQFFSWLYWKPFLAMTLLVLICLCVMGLVGILRIVFLGSVFGCCAGGVFFPMEYNKPFCLSCFSVGAHYASRWHVGICAGAQANHNRRIGGQELILLTFF